MGVDGFTIVKLIQNNSHEIVLELCKNSFKKSLVISSNDMGVLSYHKEIINGRVIYTDLSKMIEEITLDLAYSANHSLPYNKKYDDYPIIKLGSVKVLEDVTRLDFGFKYKNKEWWTNIKDIKLSKCKIRDKFLTLEGRKELSEMLCFGLGHRGLI